jgi:hypothetical protein
MQMAGALATFNNGIKDQYVRLAYGLDNWHAKHGRPARFHEGLLQ